MDVLSHMLTDPLDPKEDDGQITEECMLGNCRVSLPEVLLEDVSYELLINGMVCVFWQLWYTGDSFMMVFIVFVNSLKYSSLWWVKAPGPKFCQIPRGSISNSSCRSFLITMLQSKTLPSVIYSTTAILILEIPFILHKSYSEVNTQLIYQ